ncbi:BTAD domain-containing putative transcriptional regulator [Streptomyces sp. NPDC026092]|uniref:AfsR/SARP family transcriptional regulator n=1 Tax=Streptomyces sp. NPDC026092 TaxID=3154797 RepID=UPI0033F4B25C
MEHKGELMATCFGVLGPIEVRRNGVPVDVGHAMQRRVLAALLVDADRVVSSDALVDRVWGEADGPHGRTKLYGYVSRLRHVLAGDPGVQGGGPTHAATPLTRERGGGYRLAVEPASVDVHRFRELSGLARKAGTDEQAEAVWREALGLWRGSAFAGVDTPWFNAQRDRLDGERLTAQLELVDVRLRLAQHGRLVSELLDRAAAYPLDERVVGQLMLALYRCGRQAEALDGYERARRRLADELGIDPGAELRRLHARILAADPELARGGPVAPLSTAPSAVAAPVSPPHATGRQLVPRLLPPDLSLFVGRKRELADVYRSFDGDATTTGPVTLLVTGPAGVGKTAFAVRAAHGLASRFPDGQLHADLRGFGDEPTEPYTVLGTFLRALGASGGSVPGELADRVHLYRTLLAQRRVLVVLDNAADAQQLRDLMPSGGQCAALITSRTTLAEMSGRRITLGVLSSATALALLREMLGPGRTDAEPDAARSIVETCGGLPLAVWVAGARLAARPHWPLSKVARALADEQRKLDELAVGHIAVRASLGLTYQGMSASAQRALRTLALLPGPAFAAWALAALLDVHLDEAEAVLDDLVEVHLVQTGTVGATGIRYQLHDLVRLFAREQAERGLSPLDRTAALGRLLGASLHLTDHAADALSVDFQGIPQKDLASWRLSDADAGPLLADPPAWFDDERQFLVGVVEQALDRGETAPAAGLATALTAFFQVGSHFDDWGRLQSRALKVSESNGDDHSASKLHRCLGELTTILDRYPEALHHFERALQLAEGQAPAYRAGATAGLAYVHRLLGEYASAVHHFEAAVRLAESAGNVNCLVYATNGLGVIDLEQGRLDAAVARFTECLLVSRRAGYLPGEAQALRCLGQSHRARGAYADAADAYRQAAAISEELGDRLTATHATCWLGDVLTRLGEHGEGRRLLAKSLWTYREFGNLWGEAATLYALAEAHLAVGRPHHARRRAEAAIRLWRSIGSTTWLATALDTLAKTHDLSGDNTSALRAREEARAIRA